MVHGDLDSHHAIVHFEIAGPERAKFGDQALRTTFDIELERFECAEANFIGKNDLGMLTRAHWHCWADGHRPSPLQVKALAMVLSKPVLSRIGPQ